MNMLKKVAAAVLGTAAITGSNAFATAPDYSTLVSAVDFSSVMTSALTVGALAAGVYVLFKGIKLVIRVIRGA